MESIVSLIYANYLLMKNPNIQTSQISKFVWPIVREDNEALRDLRHDFLTFLDTYAANSQDLEEWPIVRFLEIWCT